MAEIDGGALSFKSVMDNDQMNAAIDETLRRVQGLSDGTVVGGQKMDAAFDNTADGIRNALGQIGAACEMHEQALQNLESEYQRLGQQAGAAFMAGRDEEYQAITQQQAAIKGEMTVREHLIRDLQEQSNRLEDTASKMDKNKRKTEDNTKTQGMLRTQLMNVKNALAEMEEAGLRGTKQFSDMQKEVGRLQNAMGDANMQAKILSHDNAGLQGVISAVGGISGAMSTATGVVSLFAGENENLQKVMTKIQSVMAISMGIQQVANTLNKDSAFSIVILGRLKEWWAGIVTKATVAATAGTVANIGLAGAFRLVGVAIKSIPVFGWILAGISALVGLVGALTSESRKAAKETKEMNAAIVEGSYKAIGSVQNLSSQWSALGDNLDAKKKFIEENKKAFDELGVSIRDVADAEKLLAGGAQAFIEAQIAKAKAAAVLANSEKWVKQSVEADLELEQAKKKPKVTRYVSGGQFGGGYSYEIDNPAIQKAIDKQTEANTKLQGLYADAAKYTAVGLEKMKEAGVDGQDKIIEGTVAWYEKQIADKQAYLKTLSVLDDAEIKSTQKQIADFQKIIDDATGKKTTGGSSNSKNDPFLEKLEKQKKEYTRFQKWMNSGDDVLSKAATTEFDGLLKQGATYIDYLKKQREIILSVDVANRSKAQNQQLRTLNDQIAEETKKTVLESFNTELSEQLNNAKTTLEILNIISQKRKELANDGTDVDNGKKDSLDEAEKDVIQKQKEETDTLLDEYSSYLDQRVKLHQKYLDDIALLEKRKQEAQSPEEAAQVQRTIESRTKQYEKDKKGTGDVDYDAMVQQYATFEQKKQSIIDEYDEKRKQAQEHGNTQLVEELNKAQAKALSSLAIDEMQVNPDWEKMFGNLDEISTNKLQELLDMVEGKTAFLGVDFDPKDLEIIKNKVEEIKNEVQERNPFKALISSIKDYSKATDDESKKKALTNMFGSASGAIDLVSGALDAVVGGMEKMGIQMDEETQAIIGDIGGILDGASQLASGIATGNPLAIIQGGIGLLSSAFDLFNSRDRKAEKAIKRHAEALKQLESSYQNLSRAVDKALGSTVYDNQKAAINNMQEQQRHLQEMIIAEDGKKKTDHGKIEAWQQQIKDLGYAIEDTLEAIANDVLQTSGKSFADELGDALVNAFSKGEDAAEAFGETTDKIIKQAVLNQLKKNFLETQLQGALDGLYKSMGGKEDGTFVFDGLSESEIAAFKNQVAGITTGFNQALSEYSKIFNDIEMPEADTSLTGAVKGVSEETATIVAGQMNAIRINQIEATAILRKQLAALAKIANNTSYNFHLAKLERIVTLLENSQSSSSLRSQGLL